MAQLKINSGNILKGDLFIYASEYCTYGGILSSILIDEAAVLYNVAPTEQMLNFLKYLEGHYDTRYSFVENTLTLKWPVLKTNTISLNDLDNVWLKLTMIGPILRVADEVLIELNQFSENELVKGLLINSLKTLDFDIQDNRNFISIYRKNQFKNDKFNIVVDDPYYSLVMIFIVLNLKESFLITNISQLIELDELTRFLNSVGYKISLEAERNLRFGKSSKPEEINFRFAGDKNFAELILSAAVVCGGEVMVHNINWIDFSRQLAVYEQFGYLYTVLKDGVKIFLNVNFTKPECIFVSEENNIYSLPALVAGYKGDLTLIFNSENELNSFKDNAENGLGMKGLFKKQGDYKLVKTQDYEASRELNLDLCVDKRLALVSLLNSNTTLDVSDQAYSQLKYFITQLNQTCEIVSVG